MRRNARLDVAADRRQGPVVFALPLHETDEGEQTGMFRHRVDGETVGDPRLIVFRAERQQIERIGVPVDQALRDATHVVGDSPVTFFALGRVAVDVCRPQTDDARTVRRQQGAKQPSVDLAGAPRCTLAFHAEFQRSYQHGRQQRVCGTVRPESTTAGTEGHLFERQSEFPARAIHFPREVREQHPQGFKQYTPRMFLDGGGADPLDSGLG